jgi:small nuclear ribonucleoprotein B and B'
MSKTGKMQQWLNYKIRVTVQDRRDIIGQFMAFDKHMNLIIADAEEYRRVGGKGKGKEEKIQKRTLGLLLLRGENIVSLSIEGPPPPEVRNFFFLLGKEIRFFVSGSPGLLTCPRAFSFAFLSYRKTETDRHQIFQLVLESDVLLVAVLLSLLSRTLLLALSCSIFVDIYSPHIIMQWYDASWSRWCAQGPWRTQCWLDATTRTPNGYATWWTIWWSSSWYDATWLPTKDAPRNASSRYDDASRNATKDGYASWYATWLPWNAPTRLPWNASSRNDAAWYDATRYASQNASGHDASWITSLMRFATFSCCVGSRG